MTRRVTTVDTLSADQRDADAAYPFGTDDLSLRRPKLAERRGWPSANASTVRRTMGHEQTYAVTLIKAGGGIPQVEVGAYRYTGDWLPEVGETIVIRPAAAPDEAGPELQGFVTKVNPVSDTPISVVEVESQGTLDDVVLPPGGSDETY